MYGFYEEVMKKYGSIAVWKMCNEVFDYLPLASVVNSITSTIQMMYFVCTEDSHLISELSKISRTLTGFVKYLHLGDLEILSGQTLIKLMDGCLEAEELDGFLELDLQLNLMRIIG